MGPHLAGNQSSVVFLRGQFQDHFNIFINNLDSGVECIMSKLMIVGAFQQK